MTTRTHTNALHERLGRALPLLALALALLLGLGRPLTALASEGDLVYPEDGLYVLESKIQGKVLDVAWGSTASGANVWSYRANTTPAQRWRITRLSDGHYSIVNANSGKALDVAGGKKASGTNVQVWDGNGSPAQRWDFVKREDGLVEVRGVGSGLVLDISSGSTADGANIQTWQPNGTAAQGWNLAKVERAVDDGVYTLATAVDGSKVLDVAGGSTANGAGVQLYASNGTAAQKWDLTYDEGTGYYSIRSACSGLAMDVPNGKGGQGSLLQQWQGNGTVAQRFAIRKNEDGTYTIASATTGFVLDVPSAKATNGVRVQLWSSNGTKAQRWALAKATPVGDGLYSLTSSLSSKAAMGVKAGTTEVRSATTANDLSQKWELAVDEGGVCTIRSAYNGLYLADNGSGLAFEGSPTDASRWVQRVGAKGGVTFLNASTGKAIDLANASTAAGTRISTYAANGTGAQSWMVSKTQLVPEGYYELYTRAAASGAQALDVSLASTADRATVQTYQANHTAAQIWKVTPKGDGWYTILNANSGKALDVKDGKPSSGTVWQFTANGTAAQLWKPSIAPGGGVVFVSQLDESLAFGVSAEKAANGTGIALVDPATTGAVWDLTAVSYQTGDVKNPWNDASYVNSNRSRIASAGSSTNYGCVIDTSKARVMVFQRSGSSWALVLACDAALGRPGHKTFRGTYTVDHKNRAYWNDTAGPGVNDWWTCYLPAWSNAYNPNMRPYMGSDSRYQGLYEDGQGFHYGYDGSRPGYRSGGCTCTSYDDAKWIYDNVPIGSKVVVF